MGSNIKLDTIQKRNQLNEVRKIGSPGPGGAYHSYAICRVDSGALVQDVQFQKGPRAEPDSIRRT